MLLIGLRIRTRKNQTNRVDKLLRTFVVALSGCDLGLRQSEIRAKIWVARKLSDCRSVDVLQRSCCLPQLTQIDETSCYRQSCAPGQPGLRAKCLPSLLVCFACVAQALNEMIGPALCQRSIRKRGYRIKGQRALLFNGDIMDS